MFNSDDKEIRSVCLLCVSANAESKKRELCSANFLKAFDRFRVATNFAE